MEDFEKSNRGPSEAARGHAAERDAEATARETERIAQNQELVGQYRDTLSKIRELQSRLHESATVDAETEKQWEELQAMKEAQGALLKANGIDPASLPE
ncbi:MAG TPA: hypothetical protein VMV50_00980 [Candidatus Paceibacterota bacterium]|nr:hypothetical protein [Candidatus Paceibacterota bacterium]